MRGTIWDKKIPTFLGIILLSGGILITTMLARSGVIFQSRAGPTQTPHQVRISNVSDTSFTVTYTTEVPILGSIRYGKDATFGSTALDDRDQQKGTVTAYTTHYITVKNLSPTKKYFFTIISGETVYDNNGQPFDVTTGPVLTEKPPEQNPLAGKVVLPNGSPASASILTMILAQSQMVSVLTNNDGTYLLPLNSIRNANLSAYYRIAPSDTLHMILTDGTRNSNVVVLASQTNPVPLITLSQNYDFTAGQEPLSATTNATASAEALFPIFNQVSTQSQSPKIITPGKQNEGFADQQPNFQGTAVPNSDVQITIHSIEQIQATVKANKNGSWSYRPSKRLSPGEHTITITTRDAFGNLKTVTQSFVIYAAGTQVSESATPSATPIVTIKPTVTTAPTSIPTATPVLSLTVTPPSTTSASITPTVNPSLTVTPSATPSATPTLIPTSIPTPTAIIAPTLIPTTIPVTGTPPPLHPGNESFVVLGIGALLTTAIGIMIFIAAHSPFL